MSRRIALALQARVPTSAWRGTLYMRCGLGIDILNADSVYYKDCGFQLVEEENNLL